MLGRVRFFRLSRSLIKIPVSSSEVKVTQFARAKGPGGQHVNRKATAVEIRFPLFNSWMSDTESNIISEHLRLGLNDSSKFNHDSIAILKMICFLLTLLQGDKKRIIE